MALDTREKLSHITISLHWLVGLTIIGLMIVGIYMHENEVYSLFPIHKSTGVLIFVFVLARVAWRIKNGWPKPASIYKAYEQKLSKVVHWVLIIGTVVMPISGMMMSGAGGHGIPLFGIELLAANYTADGEAVPYSEAVAGLGHILHGLMSKIMIAAIALHILGALKHHIIDKDGTLKRMLGKTID